MRNRQKIACNAMVFIEAQGGKVKRSLIAAHTGEADSYLEIILCDLRNAGLVRTMRGPNGGYMLSRSADFITLYDILSAIYREPAPKANSIGGIEYEIWKKNKLFQNSISLDVIRKRVNLLSEFNI